MTVLDEIEIATLPIERVHETRPHRFTLAQYYRLSEMNFFGDRKVEFIDGEIIDMASQLNPHSFVVSTFARRLFAIFAESNYWVRIQTTLETTGSAPEPDFAILRGPATSDRVYANANDALLVIEVADSTLLYDTTHKASLYAANRVPEYWVFNIPDREIIVHREPTSHSSAKFGWKYSQIMTFKPGSPVAPICMPSHTIDPADILPEKT